MCISNFEHLFHYTWAGFKIMFLDVEHCPAWWKINAPRNYDVAPFYKFEQNNLNRTFPGQMLIQYALKSASFI